MSRHGRIHIIPYPKAEPDLDQIVLGVLAALDELVANTSAAVEPMQLDVDDTNRLSEQRAS